MKDNFGMLPSFMGYFQTNLAKAVNAEMGRKSGRVFARRYDAALVVNDEDLLDRLRYTLGNAVKAGLVVKSGDWKGLSSYGATMTGEKLSFKQLDATAWHNARRSQDKKKVKREDFIKEYDIPIATPDCLIRGNPDVKRVQGEIGELLQAFEEEHQLLRKTAGTTVLGMENVLQCQPTDKPKDPSFSPRVPVFCKDKDDRKQILESRRIFAGIYMETFDGFRKATRLRKRPTVDWPDYSCPPSCPRPVGYEQAAV